MEKLIILDFNTGDVDIYPVSHIDDAESVIKELGHNVDDCQWMVSNGQITFHKEVLR
jgi:hypothetical protein